MSIAEIAAKALEKSGGRFVEPPTVLEAKVPLELSGEAVRARICTFVDRNGQEWALRPDLTLVVAQAEVKARLTGESGDLLRRYHGPVFRLPANPGDPVEYDQIGIERFGAERGIGEDVWLFQTLAAAAESCGVTQGHAKFGDLSVFPAFVDALDFAPDTAAGLKRAFRQAGGVRAYLDGQARQESGLSRRLTGMAREDIADFVEDIFAMTNVRPVGERRGDEIVERLYARAKARTGSDLTETQKSILDRVLELDVDLAEAPGALAEIARDGSLDGLDEMLRRFAARTEQILSVNPAGLVQSARFATRFGRRFTYYDGFVFEVAAATGRESLTQPFLAGGRYDSLLSDLSDGAVSATALGGVVIPHRLARLIGVQA